VDTIAVKGRIGDHRILDTRQRQSVDPGTGEITTELLGAEGVLPGGVRVRIAHHNNQSWARIEQSVPNYLHGINIDCTPLHDALGAVRLWHEQASDFVDWVEDADHLLVMRTDLPRDFHGVQNIDHLLTYLSRLPVSRATLNERYADGQRGNAQTLRRGVLRSWVATAYDKTAEVRYQASREKDPMRRDFLASQADRIPNRLRFEPSLRRPYLERKGVRIVSDLNDHVLSHISRDIFDRARFGEQVGGGPHLHEVLRQLSETDPDNVGFVGPVLATLYWEALGIPDQACGKTAQRNRRLAKKWGISAADILSSEAAPVMLDYDLGALRAAA
jgi:hypothetical protein